MILHLAPCPISGGHFKDFEDRRAQGFRFQAGAWKFVAEEDGNLVLDLDNTSTCCLSEAAFGSADWQNYAVEYRVRILKTSGLGTDLFFRKEQSDFEGAYYIKSVHIQSQQIRLFFVPAGSDSWLGFESVNQIIELETWYSFRVEVQGARIRVFMDGGLLLDVTNRQITNGSVGLSVERLTHAQFDDVRVIALSDD